MQASQDIAQKWVRDQKKVGTTLPMTVTRTPGAYTAMTATHMEPKVTVKEEPTPRKGLPVPGIPNDDDEIKKEEENRAGVPLTVDSGGEEEKQYYTPTTSPIVDSREKKKTVTFERGHEETGESTRSLIEEVKQALGEDRHRRESTVDICRVCKGASHEGEPCLCLLCNTRHDPKGLCPCGYCGSREHTPRECTSSAAETSRYFADKTLRELQLSCFPCRVCRTVRAPHKDGCPYYEEPPEKKTSIEKLVPNETVASYQDCPACGGNHMMEQCLIRDTILKQGYCDICEAEPGRHYEDCPLIELYDDYGICFYCTHRDHSYVKCPFLVKRVGDEGPKVPCVRDPSLRRETDGMNQNREETRRQLNYHGKGNGVGEPNHRIKMEQEEEELNLRNGKPNNLERPRDNKWGKNCKTHHRKKELPLEQECYESGGHLGPTIGHQYDTDEVRLARTLQQHYDQLKEQKDAAKRALQVHLTATQPSSTCDQCGRTGHSRDNCPTLTEPLATCQLCGDKGHDALGCPHNIVTRKRRPCSDCGQVVHHADSCPHGAAREFIPRTLGMRQEKFLTRPPAMPIGETEEDVGRIGIKEEQRPCGLRGQTYAMRQHGGKNQEQEATPPNQTGDKRQTPPPPRGRKQRRDEESDQMGKGMPGGGGDGGDGDGDGSDRDPDESDDETDDTDEARTKRRRGKRRRIVNKIVVDT